MKLWVQTLGHAQEAIEVNENEDTFDDLRQKIKAKFNFPEDTNVLLIHQTKLISKTNTKICTNEKIKDGDKLIIMKKKTSAAVSPPTPSPVPVAASVPVPISEPMVEREEGDDSMVLGPRLEQSINDICAMGFGREAVVQAMQAAYNNPHRAVEYLMSVRLLMKL